MDKSLKSAFITIIGRPNVGKSSILNSILPYKVAAVSNKPQTTRTKITGIYTNKNTQLVFIDTPGFHKPRNTLGENMIKAVNMGMSDVDAVVFVIESTTKFKLENGEIPAAEAELLLNIKKRNLPVILAINKIDLLKNKEDILGVISTYSDYYDFSAVVPLSAKNNDGVNILIDECFKFAKSSVHYFSEDAVTDQPDKVLVCEIIREKMLWLLDKEIPHGIAVDLEKFYEHDNKNGEPIIEIHAVIYCEKDSHKGVIIGKNGSMLKNIGIKSRVDLEKFFGCKCNIKLWVKVKENWRNNISSIIDFGLKSE